MRKIPIRRTDTEKVQVGDPYDGIKRYYDQNMEMTVIKLMTGDCYWTAEPREMIVTILGSCISVCMWDDEKNIGGMNHILLPGEVQIAALNNKNVLEYPSRYGAYAMEELINGILKLGGNKSNLKAKVFGGGNVINNSAMIGDKNIAFARSYLNQENIPLISEDVGGNTARRLHFFPETGKAMIRKLRRKEDLVIVEKEKEYQKTLVEDKEQEKTDVELF